MPEYDVQVTVAGTLLPSSSIPVPMSITHGRSSAVAQPDTPTLVFEYAEAQPPGLVGDQVTVGSPSSNQAAWVDDRVSWVDGAFTWRGPHEYVPRFVGRITAMQAFEEDGQVYSWEVHAVGPQAALGRIPILMVRPIETDIERVTAIAAEVGYTVNIVGTSDLLLAADTIDTMALDALHQVCESSAGLLWQGKSGGLWYGAANHRQGAVQHVLGPGFILDGVEWTNDNENIVNSVTVVWGQESISGDVTAVWNYKPGITQADPGSGNIHFDPAGEMAVHRLDSNAIDMSPVMRGIPVGTAVYIQEKSNAENYVRGQMNAPVVDNGDWFRMPMTIVESAGGGLTVNDDVMIRFGAGTKQQETFTDDDSIAEWGLRHVGFETLLLDGTRAGQLGLLILGRRAQPYWRMPGVIGDYSEMTVTQAAALDAIEVSEGITIPVETAPGPTPGDATEWTLEGWVEEWNEAAHEIQLALSDRRRTGSTGIRSWEEMRNITAWALSEPLAWVGNNGIADITDDGDGAHSGEATAGTVIPATTPLPVVPGDTVMMSVWLMADAGGTGRLNLSTENSSGGWIEGKNGSAVTLPPGVWVEVTDTLPVDHADAATTKTRPRFDDVPVGTRVRWRDFRAEPSVFNDWTYWTARKYLDMLIKGVDE